MSRKMSQEKIKIRLKGHETFILREGWVTKGLYAVQNDTGVFGKNYGADALGVGTNMAKAIRYWLKESGLTVEPPRQGVHLSDLGRMVLQYDPYLEDDFTLWLIHVNLCRKLHTVTSWYLFFNTLPAKDFTKEELCGLLTEQIQIQTGNMEPPARSVTDDCSALLAMYTREHLADYDPEDKKISPFARLGLIKKDGTRYHKAQPDRDLLDPLVVFYLIQQYFHQTKRNSVSIADLLKQPELPGRLLNLKRTLLNEYLDQLADEGLLIVNRTAGLDMVYQNSSLSTTEVAEHYYNGRNE